VGAATLLFQLVPAPPEPVRMVPESLRPSLLNREEPLFTSLMGAFGAIGVAFMVVINTYEVPIKPADPLDIFFSSAHAAALPPKVMLRERKIAEVAPTPASVPKEAAPKEAAPAPMAVKQEAAKPQTRDGALANTALGRRLKAIGTAGFGKTNAGTTAPSFGNVASDSGGDIRTFTASTGGGSVGVTFTGAGGTIAAGAGGPVEVRKMVAPVAVDQPPAATAPGDSDCIKKARSYSRRIQTCVDTMFAANPRATGAITVRWDVVDGDAAGIDVLTNQTGDTTFAACVTNQISSWNFGDLTCSVPGYTWRVSSL